MIDLAALSASVHGAAIGNSPVRVASTPSPSPELLQRLALIKLLVALVARRQQQLRAQGVAAAGRALSPPPPTVTARSLAVQKISTAVTRARDAAMAGQVDDFIGGGVKAVGGAALAGLATGGLSGGLSAATTALSSFAAAAPVAVPLATAGIIAGIVVPAIVSGDMFSNHIDPVFDATTAEGQARARRQAILIKASLATTGTKFGFKGEPDPERFFGG